MNDYIKFRQEDLNDENQEKNIEQQEEKPSPEELEKNSSSYYYLQYLNGLKQ